MRESTWNQGFPTATPEEEARATALATATDSWAAGGESIVGTPTIDKIETEDHIANGEYLIKIVATLQPTP